MIFRSRLEGVVARGVTFGVSALLAGGCAGSAPDEQEPTCLSAAANLDCQASYGLAADGKTIAPTFQQVFDNTLPNCTHSNCHGGSDPAGGLELDDIQTAHQELLAKDANGEPRVTPGDVKCGKVIVRLEMAGKPWSMPRGGHLDERDLCAIRHWIAEGAPP
jgi:hypothetical protein